MNCLRLLGDVLTKDAEWVKCVITIKVEGGRDQFQGSRRSKWQKRM